MEDTRLQAFSGNPIPFLRWEFQFITSYTSYFFRQVLSGETQAKKDWKKFHVTTFPRIEESSDKKRLRLYIEGLHLFNPESIKVGRVNSSLFTLQPIYINHSTQETFYAKAICVLPPRTILTKDLKFYAIEKNFIIEAPNLQVKKNCFIFLKTLPVSRVIPSGTSKRQVFIMKSIKDERKGSRMAEKIDESIENKSQFEKQSEKVKESIEISSKPYVGEEPNLISNPFSAKKNIIGDQTGDQDEKSDDKNGENAAGNKENLVNECEFSNPKQDDHFEKNSSFCFSGIPKRPNQSEIKKEFVEGHAKRLSSFEVVNEGPFKMSVLEEDLFSWNISIEDSNIPVTNKAMRVKPSESTSKTLPNQDQYHVGCNEFEDHIQHE